jgi:hypothetical protein
MRESPLLLTPALLIHMPAVHMHQAAALIMDGLSHAESATHLGSAAGPDTLQLLLPPAHQQAKPLPLARQRSTVLLLPAAGGDPGDLAALPGLNDAQRLMFSAFAVRTNPNTDCHMQHV